MNVSGVSGITFESFCVLMEQLEVLWQNEFHDKNNDRSVNNNNERLVNVPLLTDHVSSLSSPISGHVHVLASNGKSASVGGNDCDDDPDSVAHSPRTPTASMTSGDSSSLLAPSPRSRRLVALDANDNDQDNGDDDDNDQDNGDDNDSGIALSLPPLPHSPTRTINNNENIQENGSSILQMRYVCMQAISY
jgi:hypothetical protein